MQSTAVQTAINVSEKIITNFLSHLSTKTPENKPITNAGKIPDRDEYAKTSAEPVFKLNQKITA